MTFDTTRADALGCYGRVPAVTPNLDRLASRGLVFENAHTVAPITLPAHASMLTGLFPVRHGLRQNGLKPLPASATTLAEGARAAGHQTAAFVGAVVLSEAFGLAQGFDHYDEPREQPGSVSTHFGERSAGAVVDAALAWLARRDRERPFFVWLHFFDPHAPYAPPPEFRAGALEREPYLGELAYADRELGRFLDALQREGVLERTTVLVVSDHGEAFGEHEELTHGSYCYQSTLHVPLILRVPGRTAAGRRSKRLVSVVDVFPTLADAMGLDELAKLDTDGRSLLVDAPADGRGLYFESYYAYLAYGWSPIAGWMDERGKFLHSSTPQLFDLDADPGELRNLIAERDAEPYRAGIGRLTARPALPGGEAGIDADLKARIRSLGYAGVEEAERGFPHPLESTGLPSPASMASVHRRLMDAMSEMNVQRYERALTGFESVLAADPDNPEALDLAAVCSIQLRRYADAVAPLQRLLALGRARATTHYNLAISLWRSGRADEAHAAFLRALELAPREARILQALVQLLRAEGRAAEARVFEEELAKLGSAATPAPPGHQHR